MRLQADLLLSHDARDNVDLLERCTSLHARLGAAAAGLRSPPHRRKGGPLWCSRRPALAPRRGNTLKMRLPFPAAGLSPAAVPQEYWARPAGREGPFAPNTLLQRATRLFKGKVVGSGARWDAACWGQGGRPRCVPGVVGWGKVVGPGTRQGWWAGSRLCQRVRRKPGAAATPSCNSASPARRPVPWPPQSRWRWPPTARCGCWTSGATAGRRWPTPRRRAATG